MERINLTDYILMGIEIGCEINIGKSVIKRLGTKFICKAKGDEEIIGAYDGHLITNERIIEIPKEKS